MTVADDKFEECLKKISAIMKSIAYNENAERYILTELEFKFLVEAVYIQAFSQGYIKGTVTSGTKTTKRKN